MRALIVGLAFLALGGCSAESPPATGESNPSVETQERFVASEAAPTAVAQDAAGMTDGRTIGGAQAPAATTAAPPQTGPSAPISYLAYSYQVGIEVPGQRLTPLMEAHTQACVSAGPRLCQLIGSQRQGDPDAYISGSLSIRGEPNWLRGLMGRLDSETHSAGGRIRSRSTSTEDLTRAIVDTEAALRAKRTLRDRLQRLLESRPGRLSDLLEVEREFARVQSEIDATESNLAVMRTRVDMSALTISYESAPRSVASDTFEPLRNALASFVRIVVQGVALIITLFAGLLPFAILAMLIVWVLLVIRRSRGGRFFRREPAPAPPAQPGPPAA